MSGRHVIRLARYRGFTLIEAVSTIVILGIVGGIASNLILTGADGYLDASTTSELHTEASIGLDRISRELRMMPLDSGASGVAPDIDEVTATSIDWDDDYSISLSGSNLMLTIDGGTSRILLSDVSAVTIAVADEDNTPLGLPRTGSACDDIRRVFVLVSLQRNGVTESLSTKVFLRCTMAGAGS